MKKSKVLDTPKPGLHTPIAVLLAFCFLLFVPNKVYAGPDAIKITHVDTIIYDEEDISLSFPAFVHAEHVMDEIYVIDSKSRFIIFTSDFFPLFTIGKRKGIVYPQGLTVDMEGNVYVAMGASKDNPKNRISVLNASLNWDRDIFLAGFEGADSFIPYRLATDREGNIYVASNYYPGIIVLDSKDNLIDIMSPDESGRKVKLNNVTIDKEGRIYLVSTIEGKIYVYNENREFLFKFGEKGGSSGKLSQPMALAVDNRNGRMYVVDYMRHTVNVYEKNGTYITEFGGLGWGPGWFQHPRDIAVDKEGRILIADTFNNRVEVFQAKELLVAKIEEKFADGEEEIIEIKEQIEKVREQKIDVKEHKPEIKEKIEKAVFEDVQFDFDKYNLKDQYKPIVQSVYSWLIKNSEDKILIEGHCDERGTNEYNFALGDRRAKTVKDYLISTGIDSSRINTVSYGEERPLCKEQNEGCWSRNRRVNFVIK